MAACNVGALKDYEIYEALQNRTCNQLNMLFLSNCIFYVISNMIIIKSELNIICLVSHQVL